MTDKRQKQIQAKQRVSRVKASTREAFARALAALLAERADERAERAALREVG